MLTFKIGLLGPTRVGKTSIVTSLLETGQQLLAGTSVTMRPQDAPTERRIAQNRKHLDACILGEEFTAGSLAGTEEMQVYNLLMDPGVPGAEILLELLDFPGGWLDPLRRPADRQGDWEKCQRFITESTVLIVPIDAAVLMEANTREHRRAWPHILTMHQVEQVVGEWVKDRVVRAGEPAMLVFCPVKCESYFADNGGTKDVSATLFERFQLAYGNVISRARSEAARAARVEMVYCPVDTLGCVELLDARWTRDPQGDWEFAPFFRIRRRPGGGTPRISRVGVDDVLTSLCAQLLAARKKVDQHTAVSVRDARAAAEEFAQRDEGLLRNVVLWLTGERSDRKNRASRLGMDEAEVRQRIAALEKIVDDLGNRELGGRTRRP